MRYRMIVMFAMAFFMVGLSFSQEKDEGQKKAEASASQEMPVFLHGLGFAAGEYSGIGLSYKAAYKRKLVGQIAVGYYKSDDNEGLYPGFEIQLILARHYTATLK